MAFGIRKTALPYILKADKDLPEQYQTIFHIKQKTLEDENENSIRYTEAYTGRGKNAKASKSKMTFADIENVLSCLLKVENYFVPEDSAEVLSFNPYEHFKKKLVDTPTCGIKEVIINNVKYLQIPLAEDESDLKRIAVCLDARSRSEIADVSEEMNKLDELEKKG